MKILLLHGANFRFLGMRETAIYGNFTLENIQDSLLAFAKTINKEITLVSVQKNSEGDLLDAVETAWQNGTQGIILNAGAYTHTSIALADALAWVKIPTVEVHISNIYAREEYRSVNYIAKQCIASIQGCGILGYKFALELLLTHVSTA